MAQFDVFNGLDLGTSNLTGVPDFNAEVPNIGTPETGNNGLFSNFLGDFFKPTVSKTGEVGPSQFGSLTSGAGALFNAFNGLQQLQLAKDAYKENKRQFDMNWGAQKSLTNASLEDRQRARVAANPNAYQSVSDYMNQYGVK